ncbi:hypothetical protein Tsubulata_014354 [Turnera subulata]|uniref:Uncharacterized protein n=1 Tax=Turnera subulata TaxID=218843 RepID=A0A9Q0F4R9_9ROSI|nr:hypothetical protein Tsubulata_014354 [Turnera subulata]
MKTVIYPRNCQCAGASAITVEQTKTGQVVEGKPQWSVTVTNTCLCTQTNVYLSCNGFQSVENVDSSILSKQGDECLVNSGNPVQKLTFTYTWDQEFPFTVVKSQN